MVGNELNNKRKKWYILQRHQNSCQVCFTPTTEQDSNENWKRKTYPLNSYKRWMSNKRISPRISQNAHAPPPPWLPSKTACNLAPELILLQKIIQEWPFQVYKTMRTFGGSCWHMPLAWRQGEAANWTEIEGEKEKWIIFTFHQHVLNRKKMLKVLSYLKKRRGKRTNEFIKRKGYRPLLRM